MRLEIFFSRDYFTGNSSSGRLDESRTTRVADATYPFPYVLIVLSSCFSADPARRCTVATRCFRTNRSGRFVRCRYPTTTWRWPVSPGNTISNNTWPCPKTRGRTRGNIHVNDVITMSYYTALRFLASTPLALAPRNQIAPYLPGDRVEKPQTQRRFERRYWSNTI